MNGGLFTGFLIFCSLLALGSFLKQCSMCSSSISYDDCQNKVSMTNCTAIQSCFQTDVQYINSSNSADKLFEFAKGCLSTHLCVNYSKGIIGGCIDAEKQGYTGSCKAKCCDGNNCNVGNLLESSTTKPTTNKISVMGVVFGFLLTFVNFN